MTPTLSLIESKGDPGTQGYRRSPVGLPERTPRCRSTIAGLTNDSIRAEVQTNILLKNIDV